MSPPNLSLIFIMICFWLTMWLVYRYLIVPVGRVLAERQGRLNGAQEEWDATHNDYLTATERLEYEMQEAAKAAAKARADRRQQALVERQKTLEAAREQADQRLGGALTELDAAATTARAELRARAEELARLFAGQLLGREVQS
jgi:F0F1-type ATP synthase membrane subunit b/b'